MVFGSGALVYLVEWRVASGEYVVGFRQQSLRLLGLSGELRVVSVEWVFGSGARRKGNGRWAKEERAKPEHPAAGHCFWQAVGRGRRQVVFGSKAFFYLG